MPPDNRMPAGAPRHVDPSWWALLGGLLLWEASGRCLGAPLLFPWPSSIVFGSLPSLAVFWGAPGPDWQRAVVGLAGELATTAWRIVVGLVLGGAIGSVMGVASFVLGRRCGDEPAALVMLRCLPLFGLIPLFVLWFGAREVGVWAYIGFASAVVVATGVHQAIANVPADWLLQARLLGASRRQCFMTVVLPALVPELKATVRNLLGLSWAFSLGAEYAGAGDGLGHLVYLSYTYADMGKIAALACVYCTSGLTVFWIWSRWADPLGAWAHGRPTEGEA